MILKTDMIVNIFISFLCLQTLTSAHSRNQQTYKSYNFDTDDRVCHPNLIRKKVEISKSNTGNRSAILVQNTGRLNDHRIHWTKNLDCRFQVDAIQSDVITKFTSLFTQNYRDDKNIGLFAVIQTMDLRKDMMNGECIDFIKFKRKGGEWTEPICGKENIGLVMFMENDNEKPSRMAFVDPKGLIDVNIFISRSPLLFNQKLELKIAFTAYKSCKASGTSSCGPKFDEVCMNNEYFGDGLVNCPYGKCSDETDCRSIYQNLVNGSPDEPCSFTSDEEGFPCQDEDYYNRETTTNTKVVAGAVATLLLSFVIFVLCVWVCKKHAKLCWADDCVNPPPRTQPTRNIEMDNQPAPTAEQTPSAPSETIDDNKDLPPSYDSLFPSR